MAQPIAFEKQPYDPSKHLQTRLDAAPSEHAEAILSAYQILQELHDRGLLELARGGLASYDEVLDIVVQTAGKPQMMKGLRNLLVLANMLSEVDPVQLRTVVQAIPPATAQLTGQADPPRLIDIFTTLFSWRTWRRLSGAGCVLLYAIQPARDPKGR